MLGTCGVPKPRRQRHGLWTRSHAALALTLRALSDIGKEMVEAITVSESVSARDEK